MTADKILIIDDEPNIRDIFSLLLKERGFVVETASTGQEGINKALKLAPDLIVLDVHLPDISGLHVLSRVKAAHPRTQVLIVTAFGTIRNAVEATQMGADDYLEKPVDNEEFLHVVERALEVKRLREEVESLKVELTNRK